MTSPLIQFLRELFAVTTHAETYGDGNVSAKALRDLMNSASVCEHKHQKWNIQGTHGHCVDCPPIGLIQIGAVEIMRKQDGRGEREWREVNLISPDGLQAGTPVYIRAEYTPVYIRAEYTPEIGDAAQKYCDSFKDFAPRFPGTWSWQELWDAMNATLKDTKP